MTRLHNTFLRPQFYPKCQFVSLFALLFLLHHSSAQSHETCTGSHETCAFRKDVESDYEEVDPALKQMTFDLGWGEQTFVAYVQPDISTYYNEPPGTRTAKRPSFNGLAGKFYNLSPDDLMLYWDAGSNREGRTISRIKAFHSGGTATFPSHMFYFTPLNDENRILKRFTILPETSHYVYDPFDATSEPFPKSIDSLNPDEMKLYLAQKQTLQFNELYREFTGREYQSMYPRPIPMHKMWRADHFGQQHSVETRETHFVSLPPKSELGRIQERGSARKLSDDQPRLLQDYRARESTLNLTLTAISCAPRAFEIQNFLSEVEVDHILELATGMTLSRSTVGASSDKSRSADTRTSRNTWVYRETSPIIDSIYRRAADVLRIDEALLRHRSEDEHPELPSKIGMAEALQLVHYEVGQEYTAHHDWGYNDHKFFQPSRFATLLLYLNEGMEGGETSFPRWVNSHTSDQLKCVPEKGKAVLFYSLLPDGNFDDLSQHAALPVTRGEKWLTNLWVWDPVYN